MVALLWALIILLLVIWLIGYLVVHVGGALINVLLLVALVLLVWNLLFSRRAAR